MLKIPKGLKKKKKGKKSKRKGEEELFTEAELEKYRREHQAQPQQQEAAPLDSDQEQTEKPKTSNNDEWSKFNALTTGVDSILKKTQGDLDRIKSTSFFQRVPAGPKSVDRCGKDVPLQRDAQKDGQRWIGFEEKKENGQQQQRPQQETAKAEAVSPAPAPVEFVLSESESEEDDFDDIFDTSYVEAVEKGEVKLAYIPDSPEEDLDDGPDPFDTSYADKVIRGPEVSKKGKKLVNIGVAVEVLTGRLDSVNTSPAAIKKAKRRIPQDLLFETSFSEDIPDATVEESIKSTSLLDDDTGIFEDVPVDLSISLHTQYIKKTTFEPDTDAGNKDILNAFDTIHKSDDEDDEFAKLASESLSKPTVAEVPKVSFAPTETICEESSWAAFEESKAKPSRPPPPRPTAGPNQFKTNFDASPASVGSDDEGPDPFDTTFAENILPGKAELKNLEEELLNSDNTVIPKSDSDFDFNPREGEPVYPNNRRKSTVHISITDPTGIRESVSSYENADVGHFDTLKHAHRDLLGGSSTDLSQLADSPIAPSASTESELLEYSDPFDTSIVNFITAPGKTELKFIENELLGETDITQSSGSLSDPDFDPRAEEIIQNSYTDCPRKASRPENLLVNKTVLFKIPAEGADSLDIERDNKKKPVTPYYAREASVTDEEVDTLEDTFDETCGPSAGSYSKPSQSILKKGQETAHLTRSTSDQDLNTEEDDFIENKSFSQLRRHSDFPVNFSKTIDFANLGRKGQKKDFLAITEEEAVDTKVLTPYLEDRGSIDLESDPFDTSVVSFLPGKTELKVLESELLSQEFDTDFDPRLGEQVSREVDLLAPSDDAFQVKALTPDIPDPVTGFLIGTEDDDIDPFDTTIAENLVPGKTELKLLESELMN